MELYILSQHEEPLAVISEDTGLIETYYRIEVNGLPDEPFTFTLESDHPYAKHVKEENKVVFKDHEGDWRLMTIKEIDDSNDIDGPTTIATCEPTFATELNDHIVVERRFVEQTADVALTAAVQGTRWQASVEVELGRATTNFYYITSIEAIWKTIDTWGGELKDVVEFDVKTNKIIGYYIKIVQRLGTEQGQRFEIDHNTTEIGRTVNSYPKTALYGRGASLEIEDEDGNATGGNTRYIGFEDVEWRTSRGDPVNKPLGQKWVGDPEALITYGYENGTKHREGIFSNQDYEDPADLLQATWETLQNAKKPEVNYRLSIELFDEKVSLGDTCQAIDRKFARPIEIQARIIALEYDLMDIEGTMVVEMGQFLDLGDNRIDDLEKEVENIKNRPPKTIIDKNSYPDRKPSTPVNLEAYGGMEVIQLYWDYADELFIKHYEVYGSRTEDFVPDTQHLLWRGDVSAFAHTVGTDEVWYYRVRAVNYHGRPSDWSVQVRAATYRVLTEDILWGPELAERMRELHRISDIIGENGVNFDQISQEAKDLINQQARIYTDEEIQITREDVMRDISEIADDLEYIDGQLVDKVNVGDVYTISDIDGMFENVVSVTRYETDMDGVVQDLEHHSSLISQNEEEILNRVTETIFNEETGYLRDSIAEVDIFAQGIEQTVRNIEIGSVNLLTNSDFSRGLSTWSIQNGVSSGNSVGISGGNLFIEKIVSLNPSFLENNIDLDVPNGTPMVAQVRARRVSGSPALRVRFGTGTNSDAEMFGSEFETKYFYIIKSGNNNFVFEVTTNGRLEVDRVQLERGNRASDWHPSYSDTDQRMTIAESSITQLANDITLKVNVDEIVSEINLKKEGIRISGNLIHLDGLTLIDEGIIQNVHIANGTIERAKLERAIIGTAQIDDLAVTSAKIASVNADKVNAASLEAISANMGTLTAGRLLSNNNNMDLNLNTGNLTMRNANFTLGNGARIDFTNVSNRIQYADTEGGTTRSSGFGVGKSLSGYPFAYAGTTGASNLDTLSPYYSGAIFNTTRAISDGGENSISGYRFQFRAEAVNYVKGIDIDFNGSNPVLRPINGGSYNYDLGTPANSWRRLYASEIRSNTTVQIRDAYGNGGWELATDWQSGTNLYIAGLNSGSYNYTVGRSSNWLTYVYTNTLRSNYLYGALQGGSARKLKKNEGVMHLEDSLEFIRNAKIVTFDWRRDENMKYNKDNPQTIYDRQVGFILDDLKMRNDYLVKSDEETIKKDNIIFIHQHVIQDSLRRLDRIDEEINWQRIEYQALRNKVTKLEDRVQQLEEMVA